MLIDSFEVEVFTPPCDPGAERFAARAHLVADISEVLPLLNATLKGAVYHPQANALTWKKGGHNVAFHAFEIATSNAEDREAAEKELASLIRLVNNTWDRRAGIEPDFRMRQRPGAMALFRLLPQTNCRQCGQPTCFTFALRLAASQVKLESCPAIFEEGREASVAGLRELLIDAPSP
jgi:ArsR family metal-binding transcriptional regulator